MTDFLHIGSMLSLYETLVCRASVAPTLRSLCGVIKNCLALISSERTTGARTIFETVEKSVHYETKAIF